MNHMDPLTLISHELCPYVQRAAIALDEKKISFERIYVDLANKPDWFKAISPLGKTPVLTVGDTPIFESAIILEYLEETGPSPLHPREPLRRAEHRGWIEFGSSILNDIWALYSAKDATSFAAKCQVLTDKFGRVEARVHHAPYFEGDHFSLVDAAYGPIFRYFNVFDEIDDFGILSPAPKTRAWRAELSRRDSIIGAVKPDYADRLRQFLKARNSHLSTLM
jgi:glutathione S-transferase